MKSLKEIDFYVGEKRQQKNMALTEKLKCFDSNSSWLRILIDFVVELLLDECSQTHPPGWFQILLIITTQKKRENDEGSLENIKIRKKSSSTTTTTEKYLKNFVIEKSLFFFFCVKNMKREERIVHVTRVNWITTRFQWIKIIR